MSFTQLWQPCIGSQKVGTQTTGSVGPLAGALASAQSLHTRRGTRRARKRRGPSRAPAAALLAQLARNHMIQAAEPVRPTTLRFKEATVTAHSPTHRASKQRLRTLLFWVAWYPHAMQKAQEADAFHPPVRTVCTVVKRDTHPNVCLESCPYHSMKDFEACASVPGIACIVGHKVKPHTAGSVGALAGALASVRSFHACRRRRRVRKRQGPHLATTLTVSWAGHPSHNLHEIRRSGVHEIKRSGLR